MIAQFGITGFKCFREAPLRFGKLTVMAGANGTGKSSVIQSLLLLRQSVGPDGLIGDLLLNGELFQAGTAKDVVRADADRQVSFVLSTDKSDTAKLTLDFTYPAEKPNARRLTFEGAGKQQELPSGLFSRGGSFAYLSAERLGPRIQHRVASAVTPLAGPAGARGEYSVAELDRIRSLDRSTGRMESALFAWCSSAENRSRLAVAIREKSADICQSPPADVSDLAGRVLRAILPGVRYFLEARDDIDSAVVTFNNLIDDPNRQLRPTHVGFGISYTLPISLYIASMRPGGLLLIENPEAHLHPASQSRIGSLLAAAAAAGVQVILETHSDHLLNGIRLAVSKKLLAPNDVAIQFFSPGSGSEALVNELVLDEHGGVDRWPAGFFDQIESDLAAL